MDIMNFRGFFRVLTDILSDRVERTPSDADCHLGTPNRLKKRMEQMTNPIIRGVNVVRDEFDFGIF